MDYDIPSSVLSLKKIKNYITRTPLQFSERLSKESGARVYLKLENFQKTGSFKARGALNKVLSLTDKSSIVAASSGNHGAAVSYALSVVGKKGVIYVPNNVKVSKVKNIESYGSQVIKHGEDCLDAENEAMDVAKENGSTFISPYNDLEIISGQGTIGVEILEDMKDIEFVFITVGGGGLIAGVANYMKSINPAINIIGCSPENSSVMLNSLHENQIINSPSKDTLSDGSAGGVEEGAITHTMCKNLIDKVCLVSEDQIAEQIKNSLFIDKMLIEGAAAVAVASVMKLKEEVKGRNVAVIICGGNIGSDTLNTII